VEIKDIVDERQATHGDFSDTSFRAQSIKQVIRAGRNYRDLSCCQREALDMMCSKLSRILEGSPNVIDHWADIAGYSECVVRYLERGLDD
jgi:hypothetical protein